LCCVRKWDLSYETLRSFHIQKALRDLCEADGPFWQELTAVNRRDLRPKVADQVAEDLNDVESDCEVENLDDSDISLQNVVEATHHEEPSPQRRRHISKSEKVA
jgi:hypothetical protein